MGVIPRLEHSPPARAGRPATVGSKVEHWVVTSALATHRCSSTSSPGGTWRIAVSAHDDPGSTGPLGTVAQPPASKSASASGVHCAASIVVFPGIPAMMI